MLKTILVKGKVTNMNTVSYKYRSDIVSDTDIYLQICIYIYIYVNAMLIYKEIFLKLMKTSEISEDNGRKIISNTPHAQKIKSKFFDECQTSVEIK